MRHGHFDSYRKRRGVSEILGALLLIVITIAAVASLSVFLSQTEKNSEARSALLTNVQNENLQVTYAQFSPSSPAIQWELDLSGTTHLWDDYYLQIVNPTSVVLTQMDSSCPTISASLSGNSLQIHQGEAVTISWTPAPSPSCVGSGPYTLTFGSGSYVVNPASWSNVTISVRNLNTEESGLYQIEVNSNWMPAWQEVSQTGTALSPAVLGGPDMLAIVIPARATLNFNLSLIADHITLTKNDSAKITLLTSAGNYFSAEYFQPTPVVTSSTTSENYQVVTRDVVTFDGSQSYSSDSSIQSYLWQIAIPTESNPEGCTNAAFSNPADLDVAYVSGETIQYLPESLFSANLGTDCITGPIQATLTVTDDNGLSSTSQPLLISSDPDIAPAASLTVSSENPTGCSTSPCDVTLQVDNIFGFPVQGAVVTGVVTSGDVTLNSPADTTGPNGLVTFVATWTAGGTVEFAEGTLPPVTVSFS